MLDTCMQIEHSLESMRSNTVKADVLANVAEVISRNFFFSKLFENSCSGSCKQTILKVFFFLFLFFNSGFGGHIVQYLAFVYVKFSTSTFQNDLACMFSSNPMPVNAHCTFISLLLRDIVKPRSPLKFRWGWCIIIC